MRKIIALLLTICSAATTYANTDAEAGSSSSSATQTIQLILTDAIEISFLNTNSSTGNIVKLFFTKDDNFANGVESPDQQVRVRSNRKFQVKMQANSEYFTYEGEVKDAPTMKVQDVLSLMISDNKTGGNSNYPQFQKVVGSTLSRILTDCTNGANQTFSVRYRATPNFQYPSGTYTVNMVYTATQS